MGTADIQLKYIKGKTYISDNSNSRLQIEETIHFSHFTSCYLPKKIKGKKEDL